jgi:hypothetical protein
MHISARRCIFKAADSNGLLCLIWQAPKWIFRACIWDAAFQRALVFAMIRRVKSATKVSQGFR